MFASNAGSEKATGEYIARMDADDWAYPYKLEKQNDFLDKNFDYGVVAGLVKHVSNFEYTEGFARFVEWSNSIQTYEDIKNRRFIEQPVVNPTAMWRKKIGEKHGMYLHGDFPEDYEMWLRWLGNGVKIHKLSEIVLEWHDFESRLTRTNSIYSDRSFYNIKTKYLADWLKKYNPFYPNVVIWGAARISRRRAKLLEIYGVNIVSYIDTKKSRQIDKKVIFYKNIPSPNDIFILVYIKQMNTKKEIQSYLNRKGYLEGENYLFVS